MNNVIVPLNAFDRFEVLEKGQVSFIQLIAEAGAFGVEIRRELLQEENPQLDQIKSEIEQYGLFTVYSAPIECWKDDYQLNTECLTEVFQEGITLGAKWIKVSLGNFKKEESNLQDLHTFLTQQPQGIQLLVENDQTLYGGNVRQLKSFFESVAQEAVPVKMAFDTGNWYYAAQDVEEALRELGTYVMYLHLKQVERQIRELVTVPLQTEGNLSWKQVMQGFSAETVKALEFPIEPKENTKQYIRFVTEAMIEREVISCNH